MKQVTDYQNHTIMTKQHRVAIFASGSGSNAENIIEYFRKNRAEVSFPIILCNNPKAYVFERAKKLNVPCESFTRDAFNSGEVTARLKALDIDFIVLAGFLWKIPEEMIAAFPDAIINIHPALLPKYGGKGMYGDNVHKAVVEAGEKESGITIHYVNEHYDSGSIIFQAKCEVLPGDDYHQVAEKVHALEYAHFPQVIDSLLK